MNRRLAATALITISLAVLILVWRARHAPLASADTPAGVTDPQPSRSPVSRTSSSEHQLPGGPYVSSDPRWAIVRSKDKSDPNWEWRLPINFYGRVLDENQKPIVGAKIHAQWSDLSVVGASSEETLSDTEGLFSITGKTGRGITVRVSKDGYYTPQRQQISFDYAAFWEANYYEPDPIHPVIFHLRKKGVSETLSAGEVQPPVAADGTPIRLDLLSSGRISSVGQLEISAITNTEKYPPRRFDWAASITVHDGGLIEHNLEFPFEAPGDGYRHSVAFEMPTNSPDWRRTIEKNYFVRFGNPPKYGRIHIRLNGASQKAFLRYAVNPTGSRNLEGSKEEEFSNP